MPKRVFFCSRVRSRESNVIVIVLYACERVLFVCALCVSVPSVSRACVCVCVVFVPPIDHQRIKSKSARVRTSVFYVYAHPARRLYNDNNDTRDGEANGVDSARAGAACVRRWRSG